MGGTRALAALILVISVSGCSDEARPITVGSKNFLEQILEEAAGGRDDVQNLGALDRMPVLGRPASLVDLALPYLRHLDPQRVSVVKRALQRLELAQQEGALLMMPEMLLAP